MGLALGVSSRSAVRLPPQTHPVSRLTTLEFVKNPSVDQCPNTTRGPCQRALAASNHGTRDFACTFLGCPLTRNARRPAPSTYRKRVKQFTMKRRRSAPTRPLSHLSG